MEGDTESHLALNVWPSAGPDSLDWAYWGPGDVSFVPEEF